MGLGQIEGSEGVGQGVVSLIWLWKCLEKSKDPGSSSNLWHPPCSFDL
jgi:hypothetical protein